MIEDLNREESEATSQPEDSGVLGVIPLKPLII